MDGPGGGGAGGGGAGGGGSWPSTDGDANASDRPPCGVRRSPNGDGAAETEAEAFESTRETGADEPAVGSRARRRLRAAAAAAAAAAQRRRWHRRRAAVDCHRLGAAGRDRR